MIVKLLPMARPRARHGSNFTIIPIMVYYYYTSRLLIVEGEMTAFLVPPDSNNMLFFIYCVVWEIVYYIYQD